MKKLLILLSVFVLLAACGAPDYVRYVEPVEDGTEEDHGTVFAKVDFMDETSVQFSVQGSLNTYPFAEDAVIKVLRGETLTQIPVEEAPIIMASSDMNDYYFNFVLSSDEVLQMTQVSIDIFAELESSSFYISSPMISDGGLTDGELFLTLDSINWLTQDVTCATPGIEVSEDAIQLPLCNPNGFLILNEFTEGRILDVSPDVTVYTTNFGTVPEATYEISFEELVAAYEANKDYFIVAPFEIGTETLEADGTEYEIVTSIQEKYIP